MSKFSVPFCVLGVGQIRNYIASFSLTYFFRFLSEMKVRVHALVSAFSGGKSLLKLHVSLTTLVGNQ